MNNSCILKTAFFSFSLFCFSLFSNVETKLEFRTGSFFPSGHLFCEIYGDACLFFEIESSTKVCKHTEIWVNVDYFSKDGHSKGLHDPTTISIANLGVGAKYIYYLNRKITGYFGLGISPALLRLKNRSSNFHEISYKMGYGAVGKCGAYFFMKKGFFIDLFFDYLFETTHFKRWTQLGGIKLGAGIGRKF